MSPKKRRGIRKNTSKSSNAKVDLYFSCINNEKKESEACATSTPMSQVSLPVNQRRSSRRLAGSSHNTTNSPVSPPVDTTPGGRKGRRTSKRLVDPPNLSPSKEAWSAIPYVSNNQSSETKDDIEQCEEKCTDDTVHEEKSSQNEEKCIDSYSLLNKDIANELHASNINNYDDQIKETNEETNIEFHRDVIDNEGEKKSSENVLEEKQVADENDELIQLKVHEEAAAEVSEGSDDVCEIDNATVDKVADYENAGGIDNRFSKEFDSGTSEVDNKIARVLNDDDSEVEDNNELDIIEINADVEDKFDNDNGNKIDNGTESDSDFTGFEVDDKITEDKERKQGNKVIEENENVVECTFENSDDESISEIIPSDKDIKESQSERSSQVEQKRKYLKSDISNKSEKENAKDIKISEDEYSRRISACEDFQTSSVEDALIYEGEESEDETELSPVGVRREIKKYKQNKLSESIKRAALPLSDTKREKETLPTEKTTIINTRCSDNDDVIVLEHYKDSSFIVEENLKSTEKVIPDNNLRTSDISSLPKSANELREASNTDPVSMVSSSNDNKLLKETEKISEVPAIIIKKEPSSEISTPNKSSLPSVAARQSKIPGRAFIIAIRNIEPEDKKTLFDCVLCFDGKESCVPGPAINKHIKSREHSLKVMEICNRDLYNRYKDDYGAKTEDVVKAILEFELTQKLQVLILATKDTYREKREMLVSKIASLKKSISANVTPLKRKPSPAVDETKISAPIIPAAMSTHNFIDSLKRKSVDEATEEEKKMPSKAILTKEEMKKKKRAAQEAFSVRLAKKQKTRKTDKIVLVMDGRDPHLNPEKLESNVRVLRILEATFSNMFSYIKSHEWFGKGTLFVFLNGEYICARSKERSLQDKCDTPINVFQCLSTNTCILIDWCLKLHKEILDSTTNDQAMFCEIIPINIQIANSDPFDFRSIVPSHTLSQYLICVKEFNDFIKKYTLELCLPFWNMVKWSFVREINDIEETLKLLRNDGISFQNEDAEKRREAVSMKTKDLVEFLQKNYNKTVSGTLQGNLIASNSNIESAYGNRKERLFQKIIFITNRYCKDSLMDFSSSNVEIFIEDDLRSDTIRNCILEKAKMMPENTLWITFLGCFCICETKELNSCDSERKLCSEPLTTLVPSHGIDTTIMFETIERIRASSMALLMGIREIISAKSEFLILPACPPTIIAQQKFSHSELHLLQLKNEHQIYFATESVISQLNDSFTQLNKEIISLSISESTERNYHHEFLSKYLLSLPKNHVQIVRRKTDSTTELYSKWKTCISDLISQILVSPLKMGNNFNTQMIEYSPENLYDHFVLIGRQEQLSQISYSENVSLSLWNLKFPYCVKEVRDKIKSLLHLSNKRLLFVIFGDFSMISAEIVDYLSCKALKCTEAISYMITKSEEVQELVEEKFNIIYEFIKRIEGVFRRTSSIVMVPLFPRDCIERIPETSETAHRCLHLALENSNKPCILEGERNVWERRIKEFQDFWNIEVLRMNACEMVRNVIETYLSMDITLIHWIDPTVTLSSDINPKYSIQVLFDNLVETVYLQSSENVQMRPFSTDLKDIMSRYKDRRIKTTAIATSSTTDVVELERDSALINSTVWGQSEMVTQPTSSEASLSTKSKNNIDAEANNQVLSVSNCMPLYQQQENIFSLMNNQLRPLIQQQNLPPLMPYPPILAGQQQLLFPQQFPSLPQQPSQLTEQQLPLVLNQNLSLTEQQQRSLYVNQLPLSVSQPSVDHKVKPKNQVNKQVRDSSRINSPRIKSTVKLKCSTDSSKEIWVKRDHSLMDFLQKFDLLPSHERTFDKAYIIGKKEMVQPLSDLNLKNITIINEDLSEADEGQALHLLSRMNLIGSRSNRSVCFLTFGLSVIINNILSTPGCVKFKCRQSIQGSCLKFQASNCSTNYAIMKRIKEIVSLGTKLSSYMSVVILPIYPSRVFCDDASALNKHTVSHLITEKGENETYILIGKQKEWEDNVRNLMQTWNGFMKDFHDKNSHSIVIPKYPYLKDSTILFKKSFDAFLDENYTDQSLWEDIVHNMIKFLIPCAEVIPKLLEEPIIVPQQLLVSSDKQEEEKIEEKETFDCEEPPDSWYSSSENCITLPVKISSVSESVPEEFFIELFTKMYSGATIDKHDGYFIVNLTKVSALLTVNKLNNLVIGDSAVAAEFTEPQDNLPVLTDAHNACFISIYVETYQRHRSQALQSIREKLSKVVDSSNYKTEECDGSCNGQTSFCKFYHSSVDRRRNPLLNKYNQTLCSHPHSQSLTCPNGEDCIYAHNIYEQMFYPTNFQTLLCPMHDKNTIRKEEICKHAHADTPEVLFTNSWKDLVVFGTQNSFEFVVGAIRALQKLKSRKDVKICLISQNAELMDTVELVINEMGNLPKFKCANLLKHAIFGNTIDDYDVFLGTPIAMITCQLSLSHTMLSTIQVGALIVDNIGKILSNLEDGNHLLNICKVLNIVAGQESPINKIFVANSYDPAITGVISNFLGITLKEVNDKAIASLPAYVSNAKETTQATESPAVVVRASLKPPSPSREARSSHSRRSTSSSSSSSSSKSRSRSWRNRLYSRSRRNRSRSSSRSRRYKSRSRSTSRSRRNSARLNSSSKSLLGKRARSPSSDLEIIQVKNTAAQHPYKGVNAGKTNPSERNLSLQSKLGSNLYSKYLDQEKAMKFAHEEDFKAFKSFPELHPSYEMFYEEFLSEYNKQFGRNRDENHKDQHWKRFWDSRLEMLKNLEWKKHCDALEKEYIEKSEIYSPFQTESSGIPMPSTSKSFNPPVTKSESFSVENTLNLLEQVSVNLGMLGPALAAIISSAREKGNNDKGLTVFTDRDNLVIIDLIREKMKSLQTASSPVLVLDVTRALERMDRLIEYAKTKGQQSHIAHDLDLLSIAKASLGKGSEFTLSLIKSALAYEGLLPPNLEEINELYLSVCKIHFEMAMGS